MVDPIDPSLPRPPQPPRSGQASQGASAGDRPAPSAGSGSEGDVVAPSLIEQLDEPAPGFDPFAVAEQAGRALGASNLSIGNANPDAVAELRR